MRRLRWFGFAATLAAALAVVLPAVGGRSEQRATIVKLLPAGAVAQPPAWVSAAPKAGGLAVDADGNVYISAWNPPTAPPGGRSDVAVFDRNGNFLRTWGVGIRGSSASLLAAGPGGLVYATISGGGEGIAVYTSNGALVKTIALGAGLKNVHDIEVDAAGNVYVANDDPPSVVRFDVAGNVTARWPVTAGTASPRLRGLAVAPNGSVYVTRGVAKHPLVHIGTNGKELSDGPKLEVLLAQGRGQVKDVDLVGGHLYVGAQLNHLERGLAVVTTAGKLMDLLPSPGGSKSDVNQVAISGKDVYASGYGAAASAASASAAAPLPPLVVRFNGQVIPAPSVGDSFAGAGGGSDCVTVVANDLIVPVVTVPGAAKSDCEVSFINNVSACPDGFSAADSRTVLFLGGRDVTGSAKIEEVSVFSEITLPKGTVDEGDLVVRWHCTAPGKPPADVYEWKGAIDLFDPSGSVLDGRSGGPVKSSRVQLQFSPRRGGPFGTPGVSGFSPQLNPQVTSANGVFGWDVADGFWRLRVRAFGYKPFTSPVYKVPPPVTGLKLKLVQNLAQQRLLIDPRGRVGSLRLGAMFRHGRRVAGLVVRAVSGKVRRIDVRGRRFRTSEGIKLGSRLFALQSAYPLAAARASKKGFRVARATFTIKRGRVVAIRLG